ncbi:hypothetical protein H310_07355 [Aphanomyces invadans]|uniref:Uncharacterized protein n=1 Tax=Aphanomyces invadans TaxID=157072 RepID=A0A024U3K2_9STRA|nr:hypothetical protein H310_07355 [Aphanomyces invadans]ETW00829.1 hypothetical protein H310_07355 [Aphanomyces invadans]|eukprot:XP_008870964.1 hypothetical protein H310_07355 [Aphanomyces invadans]
MSSWLQRVYNASSVDLHTVVLHNTNAYVFESAAANALPSVVFRASNSNLLKSLTVNETINDDGDVVLTVDVASPPSERIQGEYFIDVYMPPQSLQHLYASTAFDTVVYPNVLGVSAVNDVSVVSSGSGTIIVETPAIEAHHFRLETRGSGLIQFSIDEYLVAGEVTLVSVDAGSIALLAGNTTTNTVTAMTAGTGSIYVGRDGSHMLSTIALNGRTYGDGDIVFSNVGQCHLGQFRSNGRGNIFANSMDCHTTTAGVFDKGDIYLKAYCTLSTTDDGAGTVFAELNENVTVKGLYAPLPDVVPAPFFSSFIMPDHHPLDYLPEAPTGQDDRGPTTSSTATAQAAVFLLAVAMSVAAVIALAVYKFKKSRRSPTKNDLSFAKVSTPKESTTLAM